MHDKAIYTSAQQGLVVAFQDIESYDENNRPRMRRSAYFKNGTLILDLQTEKGKLYEKLLDNHPLNISNGGSTSTGFKKQKDDITRVQFLADGEVYCRMPDDRVTGADIDALTYLEKVYKKMPKTALANATEKAMYVFDRFGFAGMPKPKEGQKLMIIKCRITEMIEALEKNNIWRPDDSTEGKTTSGQDSEED